MGSNRGNNHAHGPGYTCYKAAKVSPAQARAQAKKAKDISDGKKKKQQELATTASLAKKEAKRQRQNNSGRRLY